MSVHTLGSTTAPTWGYNIDSGLSYNEVTTHEQQTMPANGYITTLHAYFGPSGSSVGYQLLLFGGSYQLYAQTGSFTATSEGWQSQALPTPFHVGSGASIGVGWYVNAGYKFHINSSGHWQAGKVTTLSGASGFSLPGYPFTQGGLGYYLTWIDALTVSGVSPSNAAVGTSVTISGAGFVGGTISSITFNGTAASSWTVNSDSSLTVTVPAGATTGALTVNSDHGNASTTLTVSSTGAPTVSSFTPTSGPPGTNVTITGTNFTGVTAVKFNGTPASTFTVNSTTSITADPASGSTSGTISVTNANGTGTSTGTFTVTAPSSTVVCSIYDGVSAFQTSAGIYAYDGATWQLASQISSFDGAAFQVTT